MRCIFCLSLLALTACATFPKVDAAASKTLSPRPALLTLGQMSDLMAQRAYLVKGEPARDDDLGTRAADLRAR